MKKSVLGLLLLMLSAVSFAQDSPSSKWAKKKIIVDGKPDEWNLPLKNYDNITGLFFDIENDSTSLYLCFQTKYENNEARIMKAGMKIILSGKINGKHKSVIDYPLAATKSAFAKDDVQPDPLAPRENKHAIFLQKDTLMEVKGFAGKNGLISSHDTSGIHAAINWDSAQVFTYELAIPFSEMFGNGYDLKDFAKGISLNVIINAVHLGDLSNGQNSFSDKVGGQEPGRTSGYGGMNRNRMGGRENGEYQRNRQAMIPKTELKQKIILATQ